VLSQSPKKNAAEWVSESKKTRSKPFILLNSSGKKGKKSRKPRNPKKPLLNNKEISYLSFNDRVLQEAVDPNVPLADRVRFLGIFSCNMDWFFRVRVASLRRQIQSGKRTTTAGGHDLLHVFNRVQDITVSMYQRFDEAYADILLELAHNKAHFIDETQLDEHQAEFVREYFHRHVRPRVTPIMINQIKKLPLLRDDATYLVAGMRKKPTTKQAKCAVIEVPADVLPRFLILPPRGEHKYVMFLDDVIRFGLGYIFGVFHYHLFDTYAIKITRDSELDFEDDIWASYVKRVSRGLKHRRKGHFVRFLHDAEMPQALLKRLIKKFGMGPDDLLMSGGRYHNLRDLMQFPDLGLGTEAYESLPVLFHKAIDRRKRLTETIRKRDILVHYPFQTFQYVLDFLRDSSVDPNVTSIKFAIYRVAHLSSVVNALINAARNGKKVTVVLELQARFDEENNIYWGDRLQEEGVRVIYGVEGLKFHAKVCLVTRTEKRQSVSYALIGTGNWHEETVRIYSDLCLFTSDKRLTDEVNRIFEFCEKPYKTPTFRNLIVAPFIMRKKIMRLIRRETRNAKAGRPAYIFLKLNNLVDEEIIKALYSASQAGVKIKLIVRSMLSLVPGVLELSDNIEARSIVDRYLEHTRVFVFCNAGDPEYYISSADLMTRNLDRRVEVICPVYDPALQRELQEFLDIQWADNTKARILDAGLTNRINTTPENRQIRAQSDFYEHLKKRSG
jgi:polyphosphate kinase